MLPMTNLHLKKVLFIVFIVLLVLGLLIGGFFAFNTFIYNEKQGDDVPPQTTDAELLEVRIGESASALGVTLTPLDMLEDSRCPPNANCVTAGTVRLRATLESGLGTADQVFELDTPIATEAEEVTLVRVEPPLLKGSTIEASEYVFYFEVRKR